MNNAVWLIIPIILIRYLLLRSISEEAYQRASYFPPLEGKEQYAFYIYQVALIFMLFYTIFLDIQTESAINILGFIIYIIGILSYIVSMYDFARPQADGLNNKGIYSFSRNPMYVAFFLYFLGIALITKSVLYFIVLMVFQISVHYIILSEERACLTEFGDEYKVYMQEVNRYLGRKFS
ncbi:MAG TPA: methyltransferase [Halanaerobiales bacterium]|nr:methyltransferase [Halanaerobiales bacterium]